MLGLSGEMEMIEKDVITT